MNENEKRPIKEKTIDFVKDAVEKLDGLVKLEPSLKQFPEGSTHFSYTFSDDNSVGKFTLSGEEVVKDNSHIFDYLFEPEKKSDDVDLLLPKSRFVTRLLNEVFDRYGILSHRVGELKTQLKPAPVFVPQGTSYSLVSGGSASGKDSTMTVIEAHMSVDCKLHGKTESFIDIMVCDEKGNPVSAEQQVRYLKRRKDMLKEFKADSDGEVSDADKQFFEANLHDILSNVMNGWRDTLDYPRDNKLGQYFKKVGDQFNFELASSGGKANPDLFRPTVELKLLSLYYLQTPCVDFDYQIKDAKSGNHIADFSLRVNRNDNKTVFHCGICDNDCEIESAGQKLYICSETGEVFSEHCHPIRCADGKGFVHPGNEHKKWLTDHPALQKPPKNCSACEFYAKCFDAKEGIEYYSSSNRFHQCGEQGCKTAVCENLLDIGLAAKNQDSEVFFCHKHMSNVCENCGEINSSERISECSCGKKYCLDCASNNVAVCVNCGKTICSSCGMHFETDEYGTKTGAVLCNECHTKCTCGATVGKNHKETCIVCGETEKCCYCKNDSNFFDMEKLSEEKRNDIVAALASTEKGFICDDCIRLCPGNCELCCFEGSYCAIAGTKIVDRAFPAVEGLWGYCESCGEEYPLVYLSDNKCHTCLAAEVSLIDRSQKKLMKREFLKHKNKMSVWRQFQFRGKLNVVSENRTRLIIINKQRKLVLNKVNGKARYEKR